MIRGGYLNDHPDVGFVLYSLLKSITVLGTESIDPGMTDANKGKQILQWVNLFFRPSFAFSEVLV